METKKNFISPIFLSIIGKKSVNLHFKSKCDTIMFESISSKIEKALHTLRGKGSITDINIAETIKEVRKALLDADVSYPIAKEFTDKVKAEALGRNVIQSIEPGQLMVKVVHDELAALMGGEAVELNLKACFVPLMNLVWQNAICRMKTEF